MLALAYLSLSNSAANLLIWEAVKEVRGRFPFAVVLALLLNFRILGPVKHKGANWH